MAAVTICSDFGAPKKQSLTLFPLFPHLFPMKWWDWMPWSSFSECWALSLLFHSPLSLSSGNSHDSQNLSNYRSVTLGGWSPCWSWKDRDFSGRVVALKFMSWSLEPMTLLLYTEKVDLEMWLGVQAPRWDYFGWSAWARHTKVPKSGRGRWRASVRVMWEGLRQPLLDLKVEGAVSHGVQAASRHWQSKEIGSSLGLSEEASALPTHWFQPSEAQLRLPTSSSVR